MYSGLLGTQHQAKVFLFGLFVTGYVSCDCPTWESADTVRVSTIVKMLLSGLLELEWQVADANC